jgi:transcriptional regulator with XRE-family HTH domain
MTLSDYLKKYGLSPSEFAARMNKPASSVTRLLNGKRGAGTGLLKAIAEATNNEVTPNDFILPAAPNSETAA